MLLTENRLGSRSKSNYMCDSVGSRGEIGEERITLNCPVPELALENFGKIPEFFVSLKPTPSILLFIKVNTLHSPLHREVLSVG